MVLCKKTHGRSFFTPPNLPLSSCTLAPRETRSTSCEGGARRSRRAERRSDHRGPCKPAGSFLCIHKTFFRRLVPSASQRSAFATHALNEAGTLERCRAGGAAAPPASKRNSRAEAELSLWLLLAPRPERSGGRGVFYRRAARCSEAEPRSRELRGAFRAPWPLLRAVRSFVAPRHAMPCACLA